MKILVASHTYIVDLNCEKFKTLSQLEPNIEVTIVVPRRWKPGGVQNKIIESQPRQSGSFRVVPISNFSENNQGLLTFGTDIISLLREFKPQIIQVEQGAKALGYAQLIFLNQLLGLKAKNVFFTWWNLPYQVKFPLSVLHSYNLKNTHGLVAGNQDAVDVLQEHGYHCSSIVMPQLGVDEALFRPQAQPELRSKLGIKADEFVVGFVGRFVEEKGILTLGQALAGLKEIPWKWLLLGRGELQSVLLEKAAEWGIKDRMIVVESVPHNEVPRYINVMNTLVLPSETTYKFKTLTAAGWKEQFGHVLIEAMAAKVPVIGSDSGEIPHVIADTGMVFPEGDVITLRDCLQDMMQKPDLANKLGNLGYQRAMSRYTNRALAQELLNFYKELIAVDS
ncbi:MAG TPA: glycosyltransferase family 4 protein [Cyanobacteria bacterium UBA11149]|nr:glycosyltransferase family 4 protein [Cyanobacteria bacterium UBA11367]HBE56634.1 glycosyltransferase family 4 protein [Cyanobacteria bacterium UBA11366]HBK65160.1 glycosyltransferase family 4 protein [Cyanobacteria bacterium UBA11166]HBR74776.1 glycosyltransferase family 4 protein [Cyanobacteria bacterium UBA11159]HBS70034.1 glycosyltransferase family 4 protein [Cyanobacteria bacterium UBA11153]HBW92010.1 glycosyltransferase family 4 protein [Cyanobacteria bacterium UBA11149]HCA95905.1 gl